MRQFIFVSFCVAAVLADVGWEWEEQIVNWQYEASSNCKATPESRCGPNEWPNIPEYKQCSEVGTQSPIDVPAKNLVDPALVGPVFYSPEGACSNAEYENNPHTLEMQFEDEECAGKPRYHAAFQGQNFTLTQFHFHSPSEHTLDGGYFPMEVHYVHKSEKGVIAVVSIQIAVGTPKGADVARAKRFHQLIDRMPGKGSAGVQETFEQTSPSGNLFKSLGETVFAPYTEFLPLESGEFNYYQGSLTTPACNTGVHWILLPKPVVVEQKTVDLYRFKMDQNPHNQLAPTKGIFKWNSAAWEGKVSYDAKIGINNRPIQPLAGPDNKTRNVRSGKLPLVPSKAAIPAGYPAAGTVLTGSWASFAMGAPVAYPAAPRILPTLSSYFGSASTLPSWSSSYGVSSLASGGTTWGGYFPAATSTASFAVPGAGITSFASALSRFVTPSFPYSYSSSPAPYAYTYASQVLPASTSSSSFTSSRPSFISSSGFPFVMG